MRGCLTTFFTMAYIVVLNPLIIGTVPDVDGRLLGIPQVAAVTALVAAVMTLAMGLVGRYPFAIAAGLGLNAVVAFGLASRMSWADAMGLVVLEGLVITALVLTGFRTAVFHAIPTEIKTASAWASACSSPSSGSSTPGSCAAPQRAPCPSSSASAAS